MVEDPEERASSHVETDGDDDAPKTREEVLEGQAQRAFASQFGIDLDPSKGEIGDVIDYLFEQWEQIGTFQPGLIDPWAQRHVLEKQESDFWGLADMMLAPYAGFGQAAEKEPERPGDPLGLYFDSVDRMMKEMTGPYPEARYFGAQGYRESYETLTPSSFDEYLKEQEPGMRAEFMAELFLEKSGRMEQFSTELAGLSSDERYTQMLQLSETAGLGDLPTYEDFLAEKRPQLEQKYRYLKPLGDEPQQAWEGAFSDLYGEGAPVTPFSQFLGRKQEGLQQQYEDTVREQLRRGVGTGDLPDLEEWFRGQRAGVQQSFQLSGPYATGRTPTGVFRPKKRIM